MLAQMNYSAMIDGIYAKIQTSVMDKEEKKTGQNTLYDLAYRLNITEVKINEVRKYNKDCFDDFRKKYEAQLRNHLPEKN